MTDRLPPLNALRTFAAAARHLSFAEAAQELCVSAAAVSHQIRSLEDHLGTILFHRSSRRLTLTSAGAALLPEIREAFTRLHNATAQMRRRELAGLVTIGAPLSFGAKWLIPRLHGFRERHPEIEVRVACARELIDFSRHEVDVSIRYGRGVYPGLHAELLMSTEFFPVCSPGIVRGDPGLAVPRDLRSSILLHDEIPSTLPALPSWQTWLEAAGAKQVDASRGPRFDAAFLTLEMAVAGRGVALAPGPLVWDDIADGRLIRPFPVSLPSEYSFFMICPQTALKKPKVKAFRDWLLEEAVVLPERPRSRNQAA